MSTTLSPPSVPKRVQQKCVGKGSDITRPDRDRRSSIRTSICQSIRMEVRKVVRTREKHFVLRLNDHERAALERVAERLQLNASETMRYLIRRADESSEDRSEEHTS